MCPRRWAATKNNLWLFNSLFSVLDGVEAWMWLIRDFSDIHLSICSHLRRLHCPHVSSVLLATVVQGSRVREVTKTLTAGKEFESDATALQTTTAPSVCYWEGDGEDVNLQQKDYEGTNKSICCVTPRGCGPAADPGRLVKVGYILRIPGGLAWGGKAHTGRRFILQSLKVHGGTRRDAIRRQEDECSKGVEMSAASRKPENICLGKKANQQVNCENSHNKLKNLWNHNVLLACI